MAVLLEAAHDTICCGDVVAIVTVLEGFDQDDVGVYVLVEHDELVAVVGSDGGTAHVVGV